MEKKFEVPPGSVALVRADIPEAGQLRDLKHTDGSVERVRLVDVQPSGQGPRAWLAADDLGREWLFAAPPPRLEVIHCEE